MCAICGCSTDLHDDGDGHVHDHGHAHRHASDHAHGHADGHGRAIGPATDATDVHARAPASGSFVGAVRPTGRRESGRAIVSLEHDVLAKNDRLAHENRRRFAERNIFALNLVSSPGAGKTTLLERTIRALGNELSIHVIEGDQATDRDAQRIRGAGSRAVQVNTGAGCHLDAAMVARAFEELDPPSGAVLAIENVGNLVCPALFDLGERVKVVIASVPEGDDKPIKYPHMFRASDVMLLNKVDLLPYVTFDIDRCIEMARSVNPRVRVFPVSATRGDGLDAFHDWLRDETARRVRA